MMVTIPSTGQIGYVADAVPHELPPNAWSYSLNMRMRNGYAEKFGGSAASFTTPLVTPYFIIPYRVGTTKFWVYAGTAAIYCDDGAAQTDLTGTAPTGSVDDRWTGGVAGGVLVLNNKADVPQFWAGNTGLNFATLTGWDANWRCASLRPFKQYLVALDVTKSGTRYGSMVKWSAGAVPGAIPTSWDAASATLDAGEQDLAETPDFLIDQCQLGDINVLYKERSMYGMQYIGEPFIFRFYRMPGDVGALARGCIANTPAGHVVLTPGDVIIHSGQGPRSLLEGRMRKWLFNNIDSAQYARSFLVTNEAMGEVWICFPASGASTCTLALVWNWTDDTFSVRELNNATYGACGLAVIADATSTWSSDSAAWSSDTTAWSYGGLAASDSKLVISASGPKLMVMESGTKFNNTTPTCTVERTGLTFDAPDIVKTVRSLVPRVDAQAGSVLTFQVGGSMDAEVAPMWSAPVSYTVGTTRKVDAFATGRYIGIRAQSTTDIAWRIKSMDFELSMSGMY